MFNSITDFLVLAALIVDLTITLVLIHFMFKYKRRIKDASIHSDLYKNKSLILLANNEILKSMNDDFKSEISDLRLENRDLIRNLDSVNEKLTSTQKKLQSFSKMLDDMKNS